MLKIGDVCHIASTQQYKKGSGPRDIAIGIREIKNGNPEDTEKEEIIIKQEILIPDGILTQAERDGLHPDMKEKCGDASIKKYKAPTRSQENTLKNDGVIILDVNDHLGVIIISIFHRLNFVFYRKQQSLVRQGLEVGIVQMMIQMIQNFGSMRLCLLF